MRNLLFISLIALVSCNSKTKTKTSEVDSLKKTLAVKSRLIDSITIVKDSIFQIVQVRDLQLNAVGDSIKSLSVQLSKLTLSTTKDLNQDKSITALTSLTTTMVSDIKILKSQMPVAMKKDKISGKAGQIRITKNVDSSFTISIDPTYKP